MSQKRSATEFEFPVHWVANIFPIMSEEEIENLAADIAEHGQREPVWITVDGKVLDGRNRTLACQKLGIEPKRETYRGDDPLGFAVSRNVKRKHYTTGQLATLAVELLPAFERQASERKRVNGKVNGRGKKECADRHTPISSDLPKAQPVKKKPPKRRAADDAAKATGTSTRAVQRANRLKEEAPDLYQRVSDGSLAVDRAERILRDRKAEAARVEKAKEDALKLEVKPIVDIRHGDFREVLSDLRDVDAIITDPPYPKEYLPLLDDLATWSDMVLKPDGILIVLFGQTYLPEVYRHLEGGRPYRWTGAYITPGRSYVSHSARVQTNWKPLIVYGGGERFSDTITAGGSDDSGAKDLHHWGQDYQAFHTLIERVTRPGQTVVDPFMGSGTTLLAAYSQGRNVIGADIDATSVATARDRIS